MSWIADKPWCCLVCRTRSKINTPACRKCGHKLMPKPQPKS